MKDSKNQFPEYDEKLSAKESLQRIFGVCVLVVVLPIYIVVKEIMRIVRSSVKALKSNN